MWGGREREVEAENERELNMVKSETLSPKNNGVIPWRDQSCAGYLQGMCVQ